MKVLHIAPMIAPLSEAAPGGAERMCLDLAREQSRKGHEVAILALRGSEIDPSENLHAVDIGLPPGTLVPVNTAEAVLTESPERAEIRRRQERLVLTHISQAITTLDERGFSPEVVHNHCYEELMIAPEVSGVRIADVPWVSTLHCLPAATWIVETLRLLAEAGRIPKVVTVSEHAADRWEQAIGSRPGVVPNGLDPTIASVVNRVSRHRSERRLAWAGRISPEKGLHILLEVMNERESLRSVPLDLFGRIYDERYWAEEIVPKLDAPNIVYHGFQPRPVVLAAFARSCAFVQPTLFDEPFGMVFIESLAAGCPVVTFRRGAAAEIVEDGVTGVFIESLDELDEALRRCDSIDRRRCQSNVFARFSISGCADRYLECYAVQKAENPN